MEALRLSTGPGQGMVSAPSALAASSRGTPLPSLPIRIAIGPVRFTWLAGSAVWTEVVQILMPAARRCSKHSSTLAANDGRRKRLPAEARTAFGFQELTVPGRLRTPVAPKASAEA